jgi:hypothetical protein
MPTLDEIKRQIEAYPDRYIFWTQKEVRALPAILDKSEHINAVTSGMINGKTWLAVCTDRRLIFLNCGMFIGVQQIQMPLDRIQSLDHEFTLFFGSISIYDGVNVCSIGMVLKSSILPFVKATEEAISTMRKGANAPSASDTASQLTKLAELKEKGYLTEEEFQSQKKKLLNA